MKTMELITSSPKKVNGLINKKTNPTIELLLITPKIAEEFLKFNVINRKYNLYHAQSLANQMKLGKWKYSGESIKFNSLGQLMDKQHTLNAIIISGIPQHMIVVRGLDPNVMPTLDTGKTRSAGDVLSMNDIKYSACCSSAAKMLLIYKKSKGESARKNPNRKENITNADVLQFVLENKIDDYAAEAYNLNSKNKTISATIFLFLLVVLSQTSRDAANIFLSKLATGENLRAQSPILYVRNKIIDASTSTLLLTAPNKLILLFKAWNLFRENKSCTSIRIFPGEKLPKLI